MTTKAYVTPEGVYLMSFDGDVPPPPPMEGAVVFPSAPCDARQIANLETNEWGAIPAEDPLSLPLARLTFWLAAAEIGVYKPVVRSHIDAMPEGPEKYQAIVWFEEATVYRRYDPLLIQLAAAEGISEPQLDALWVWALGAA